MIKVISLLFLFMLSLKVQAYTPITPQCYSGVNLPIIAQSTTLAAISTTALMQYSWPCAKGVIQGAWAATGGLVVDTGKCVWSPIKCARKAKAAMANAYSFFKNITSKVKSAFKAIDDMPAQAKAEVICGIIGGVGADVLLAILTAGAGSGKLALTLSKVGIKLNKLAQIGKMAVKIPLGKLSKLSQKYLDKVSDLVKSGFGDEVAELAMKACKI